MESVYRLKNDFTSDYHFIDGSDSMSFIYNCLRIEQQISYAYFRNEAEDIIVKFKNNDVIELWAKDEDEKRFILIYKD